MTIVVVRRNVVVVVDPLIPSVVGRIDVDQIDPAAVRVRQHLKHMKVLAIDYDLTGPLSPAIDRAGRNQAGIDGVAKLRDDDKIFDGSSRALRRIAVCLDQTCDAHAILDVQRFDAPQALITFTRVAAPRQDPHL